jgi:pimeloyl-ACP methyl ester carboxylesterase
MASVTPSIRSIGLSHDITLQYVEQGDASGVPVIFLHGVTDSWHSFEPVLPYLPPTIHAFAVTQRGHGDAARPGTGYRARDFSADVAALVDTLGLERVVVVGHSMGSVNAQRFAIDHPERIRGLVLIGTFANYRASAAVVDFWQSSVSQLTDPVDRDFARAFQESTLAQPIPREFLDTVIEESLKVPARVWREVFQGFLEEDWAGELHEISVPTLLVFGARDAFCTRADQDLLLERVTRSRLIVHENAGHAVHWEEPERFAQELVEFVNSLGTRK